MYVACIAALADLVVRLRAQIWVWHDRKLKRHQLAAMTERELKDIRLSHVDASQEWRKPFWRP